MAKVTRLKAGFGRADRGEFKVEKFNLFEDEGMAGYADLVTRSNDASSGVSIDHIKEYSRKTTTREGGGEDQIVTTTEEIYLVVQYWLKPKKTGEKTDDEVQDEEDNLKTGSD